jgi:uncharacterized protein YbjT (DUF2867 family)
MVKNILLVGAAGTVCIEVIKLLANKDVNLRIACRNPEKARRMNLQNAELKHFDYLNADSFKDLFNDIENWLLVSPPSHLNLQDQVGKMVNFAAKAGVRNVVNISALGIEDDSHPMRQIEQYIEDSGMNYTFLQPNCYMQNFDMIFRQSIVEEDAIRLPAGTSKTSFVDVRDAGEVAEIELTKDTLKNKSYRLTGPEALHLYHIADIFTQELGRKIEYKEVDEDEYRAILELDGWYQSSIDASISLCRYIKQGWNAVITSGVFDILGREPKTFREYVQDYAQRWIVPSTEMEG